MQRQDRHKRVTAKIKGTSERPRVCIFRSLNNVTLQAIDDTKGHTIFRATNKDAEKAGQDLAKNILSKKIKAVVFDRAGYKYHGKVKAVAEAMRKEGLNF